MKKFIFYALIPAFAFLLIPSERAFSQSPGSKEIPRFIDTGDPARDAADYETRKTAYIAAHPELQPANTPPWLTPENKRAWVEAHPDAYKEFVNGTYRKNAEKITRHDFNEASAEKQAYFLAHPELFIIE